MQTILTKPDGCILCKGNDFEFFLELKDHFLSKQSFSLTVNNFCKFKLKKEPNLKLGQKFNIENYEIKLNKTSNP